LACRDRQPDSTESRALYSRIAHNRARWDGGDGAKDRYRAGSHKSARAESGRSECTITEIGHFVRAAAGSRHARKTGRRCLGRRHVQRPEARQSITCRRGCSSDSPFPGARVNQASPVVIFATPSLSRILADIGMLASIVACRVSAPRTSSRMRPASSFAPYVTSMHAGSSTNVVFRG